MQAFEMHTYNDWALSYGLLNIVSIINHCHHSYVETDGRIELVLGRYFFDLPYTEENSGIVQKVKVIPFETSFRTLDF